MEKLMLFVSKLKAVCGSSKAVTWSNGKGFSIKNPTNFDLGKDVMDLADELGVRIILNELPKPNPKNPGSWYPPSIGVTQDESATDEDCATTLIPKA